MKLVKVWSYEEGAYIEKVSIGKVQYIGETFYAGTGLTNGKIYECLGIEDEFLRIVDDEEMDYLYSITNPAPLDLSSSGGHWKVVEDYQGKLSQVLKVRGSEVIRNEKR